MLNIINRFTEEQIVGLNVSDFSVEAVVLYKRRKTWELISFARFRLSPGVVENGQILQPDKLKEELKKMFVSAKPPIRASSVFLSIPDSRAFARLLSLPKSLRRKELEEAARNKAEEFVPEDRDNLFSTLKVLPVNNGQSEVFYVAAQKGLIKEWIQIFEDMSFDILGITMESISSFAGLADSSKQNDTLLLDVGARTTIASIFDKYSIRDSISIPIAGNHITDALVQKLSISHTAAEEKKRQIGMDSAIDQGEVMLAIQGQMQPVADELKKFITFYEESSGRKLKNIIIIGGTAQIKGLDKYFGDNLNLKITPTETILKGKKLPEHFLANKYINALGLARLAWQKKTAINFYQTERVDLQQRVNIKNLSLWSKVALKYLKQSPKMFTRWYGFVIIAILILGGVVWWYQDDLRAKFSPNSRVLTQEIIVGQTSKNIDNFIKGTMVSQPVFVKGDVPGLPYEAALDNLSVTAEDLALDRIGQSLSANQFVVPQPIGQDILSITPLEEDFAISDILIMRATYQFLSISEQEAQELVFINLPAKQAEKLSNWQIASDNYQLISYDEQANLFTVKVTLELQKE
jgi:type IV pilus assembly protein PilM